MNVWEFLAQAGFWQWIGLILLACVISSGLGALRGIIVSVKQ